MYVPGEHKKGPFEVSEARSRRILLATDEAKTANEEDERRYPCTYNDHGRVGDLIFLHRVEHRVLGLWGELTNRGCLLTVCTVLQEKASGAGIPLKRSVYIQRAW